VIYGESFWVISRRRCFLAVEGGYYTIAEENLAVKDFCEFIEPVSAHGWNCLANSDTMLVVYDTRCE
jgi:hypothetical protein